MCGITGVFNYKSHDQVDRDHLTKINELLSHRGPDDHGYFFNSEVGLGHRRLSIIDLTTGVQPIYNEDKSVVTVCNGEIYNFRKLKDELTQKGHKFSTQSDTEVIVHLYEEKGEEFVQELRGMFAIALWDVKRKKLILVRDRLGIKPLFYSFDDDRFLFGSEIKSIIEYPGFNKRVDFEALHDYLSFMTTSGNKTMFEGVSRLLPAEMMIVENEAVRKYIYWDPTKAKRSRYSLEQFDELFKESIESHLISDVPLGAFLSGGLDSSAVVAYMKQFVDKPIKTFSIGFTGNKYFDETPFAKKIAKHLGTEHQEFMVSPNVIDVIPKIMDFFDEPFAVSSALPTYFLAQMASEHVKVVLTGDGADEILAGYDNRYKGMKYSYLFDSLPFLKHGVVERMMGSMIRGKKSKLRKFFNGLDQPSRERYYHYMTKFQEDQKFDLYTAQLRKEMNRFDSIKEFLNYFDEYPGKDRLNKWLYVDMKTSLPNEMLTKVDRMTMAFGLEARVPFLDHKLVEYLVNLPSNKKLHGKTSKYILREVLKDKLPEEILQREKHGFEVPVDDWIRGDLKDYTRNYLDHDRIESQGFFQSSAIESILKDHWDQKANYGHQVWILLMFQVWYEKHFS